MHGSSLRLAVDLVPEGILLLGALLLGALALGRAARPRPVQLLTVVVLLAAGGGQLLSLKGMPDPGYRAYSDGLVVDRYTTFLVPVMCLLALLAVATSGPLLPRIATHVAEYHALVLLAVLGGSLLVAAREMAALWVALELLSVCLALLVGMVKTDRRGSEAAVKQLMIGAAASAILLYGFALLYGAGGSTVLVDVASNVRHGSPAAALGMGLVICALLTKLAAVPFHQWLPDTLRGAPAPVAALALGVGATAVAGSLARVVVTTFVELTASWTALVALVAAVSLLYGNLAALTQVSLRRLVGLLAVGQAGFLLLGLLGSAPGQKGVAALIFALATGGVTVAGMFAVLGAIDGAVGDDLVSLRGLGRRSPLAAAMLGLGVVSLVGVPPLIGFFAKLFLLQSAVLAGYAWLVLLALVTSVIGAVAAARLLRLMFVDLPDEGEAPVPSAGGAVRIAIGFCALVTVLLGVAAQPLFNLASGGAGSIH
jgi:NADH-quinone oxidoreductase subunit N